MYIESVPNRNSPPAILLRESCRDAGKVRKRTLANLSKWPSSLVEGLRILLKGGTAFADLTTAFDIIRSRPHGHVAAVLGTLRKLRLDRLIAPAASPERARSSSPVSSPPARSSPPPEGSPPTPRAIPSPRRSASTPSTKTSSTPPWIGCSSARASSSNAWPNAT